MQQEDMQQHLTLESRLTVAKEKNRSWQVSFLLLVHFFYLLFVFVDILNSTTLFYFYVPQHKIKH